MRGKSSRSASPSGRVIRRRGVIGNRLFVQAYFRRLKRLLNEYPPPRSKRTHVNHEQMIISASGNQFQPFGDERFGKRMGILNDLLGICLERRRFRFFERDGDRGNGVLVRTTLHAGKNSFVYLFFVS